MSAEIKKQADFISEHPEEVYDYKPDRLKQKFHNLGVNGKNKVNTIQIKKTEIIRVNKKIIPYPCDTVEIKPGDFKVYQGSDYDDLDSPLVGEESCVKLDTLFPPIIINLREDANDHYKRETLRPHEIKYFKLMGNNATIFIHGYNVPYGQFPKQISGLTDIREEALYPTTQIVCKATPILNTSNRTFYRTSRMIGNHFGYTNELFLLRGFEALEGSDTSDPINGTEAHNWFIHMEDNLNYATGQFHRNNYMKYTRIINVAWSGDVGELNYMDAEKPADRAGRRLVKLIEQLHQEGIEINIIAHSLGNRVLLTAMNKLGEMNKKDIIEHVFLWEAAVPNTALSNDPKKDTTVKQNRHFEHATEAAKKITVLYSKHDGTLWTAYYLANVLSIAPDKLTNETYIDKLLKKQSMWRRMQKSKTDNLAALLRLLGEAYVDLAPSQFSLLPFWPKYDKIIALQSKMDKLYNESGDRVALALGYAGPDKTTIQKLGDKLIPANTTQWIGGHSAMKIPTPAVMKHVYQTWIITNSKGKGMHKFGQYKLG